MLAPLGPDTDISSRTGRSSTGLDPGTIASNPLYHALQDIVDAAANLSLDIRSQADVVYHFVPLAKGSSFKPEAMTCANLAPMQTASPYSGAVAGTGSRRTNVSALVKVVCFEGLTAYRQGGGELATSKLEGQGTDAYWEEGGQGWRDHGGRVINNRDRERRHDPSDGFRSRVLAKGVVALEWQDRPKKNAQQADGRSPSETGQGKQLLDIVTDEVKKMEEEERRNDGWFNAIGF